MKHVLAICASLTLAASQGQTLSGMDPSFGAGGLNAFDLTGGQGRPEGVHPRPDGGHLIVGSQRTLIATDPIGYYQVAFARYGQRGYAYDDYYTFGQYFTRTAPLPEGGVLVIAESLFGDVSNLIALDADGDLDPGFSTDGVFSLAVGNNRLLFWDVLRMNDGRILASGYWSDAIDRMVVIRLLANGSLDPSFGAGGIADHLVGETGGLLRITANGRILCGRGGFNRGMVRLLENGALDPSFGSGGILDSYPFQPLIYDVNDFAPQADGSIVVLADNGMGRLAPDQTADPSLLPTAFGGGRRLVVQPDGKIVRLSSSAQLDRFLPTGAPDGTFNGNGSVVVAETGDQALGFIMEEDGSFTTYGNEPFGEVFLARTSPTGQPIISYGEGGKAEFNGEGNELPKALAIRADGAITCVGNGAIGNTPCTYIAQFDANGFRDLSFSTDGVQKIYEMNGRTTEFNSEGSLLIYGQAVQSFISTPRLVRYLADGTLDPSFAGNLNYHQGVFSQLPYPLSSSGDIAVDPTDHIYLTAWRSPTPNEPTRAGIKRFLPNGTLDAGFGVGGEFIYDPGVDCGAFQLATFPNGDLLAAILVDDSVDYSYLYRNKLHLVRIAPDGSLVPTFGNACVVQTYIDGLTRHVTLTRLAILPDERFVIGAAPDTDPNTFHVARFMADGELDMSLGGNGTVTFDSISDYGGFDGNNLLVYPDGSMMLVGAGYNGPGIYFQKVLADGTPDLSFGENGVFFINSATYILTGASAALTNDGQVIVGCLVQYDCPSGPPCYVLDHVLFRVMPEFSVGWELLSDEGKASDMLVFPNPASDQLTVELPMDLKYELIDYRLIDMHGRTVATGSRQGQSNGTKTNLILTDLPNISGEYLLELSANGSSRSVKVVFGY